MTNKVKKKASDAYKYLFLYPKAGAQVAKTVLSPTTHIRNFLSASAHLQTELCLQIQGL